MVSGDSVACFQVLPPNGLRITRAADAWQAPSLKI